ncbi:MAG: hypothetical protein PHE79_09700 [Eubacteriales bacterium]|nr:hypothetical protein [Eubacteriales bacterium]
MDTMLFTICVLLIATILAIIRIYYKTIKGFDAERAEYIKMIAAKNYTEYQNYEQPVKNGKHTNLIKRQQSG